jgi:hypothetical protein
MADLNSIPDEVKWRIASEFSTKLPFLYDRAFRSALGDRYDEIEQEVWMDAAGTAFEIAKSLGLPVGTAEDLAETMRTIMVILFGPGFKSETLKVSDDGAVIITRRCPFIASTSEADAGGRHTFRKCMAFTLSSIPRLNNNYSARFVRTMCTGDRQCEVKISRKAPDTAGMPAKK